MDTIELYNRIQDPLAAIDRLGDIWARSGMFDCTKVEQGKVLVQYSLMTGMTPVQLLATYHIIDGKLSKKALACLAEFRAKGGKHKWIKTGEDGKAATGRFTFEGETIDVTFTIEDAQRQGLVRPNSNWAKTPGNMLRARVIGNAIGMLAPEIVAGSVVAGIDYDDSGHTAPAVTLNLAPPIQEAITISSAPVENVTPVPKSVPPVPKKNHGPPPTQPPPIEPESSDEQAEADMGLAPVAKQPEDPGPIPPPDEVTPESEPPKFKEGASMPRRNPLVPPEQISEEMVEEIGKVIEGNFLKVANWMVKEQWIPAPEKPLTTENAAIKHLWLTLPGLSKVRAKRILTKKMAFMRAVEEITPTEIEA